MARHSSATSQEATSNKETSESINKTPHVVDASLKRRARLLINNSSIPKQTRSLISYALKIKDPHLEQVVQRVESGEVTFACLYVE
jgi:hypothetical protein